MKKERNMDLKFMTERAQQCIRQKIVLNQIFELSDLFERCEWNVISRGDRSKFGRVFKNDVLDHKIPEIRFFGKNANNHSTYIKIKE